MEDRGYHPRLYMVRIAHITDPELKQKVLTALAERRGMPASGIPEWFELDDADFVDLLNDIQQAERGEHDDHHAE
jgi:hypothetical protein